MKLGVFSLSLAVKDIVASKEFYAKLGFTVFAGEIEHNWVILKNENCIIGLFQGMFQGNILTFNPGWDENANKIDSFMDIREIQRLLKGDGVVLDTEIDEKGSGRASLTLKDPDGNAILLDQHV